MRDPILSISTIRDFMENIIYVLFVKKCYSFAYHTAVTVDKLMKGKIRFLNKQKYQANQRGNCKKWNLSI